MSRSLWASLVAAALLAASVFLVMGSQALRKPPVPPTLTVPQTGVNEQGASVSRFSASDFQVPRPGVVVRWESGQRLCHPACQPANLEGGLAGCLRRHKSLTSSNLR